MDEITRVRRSKEAARETYSRLSRWYDLFAGASEGPHMREGLALLDPQPGERVLEVGFGTGRGLVAMARAVGEAGHCVGLDLSPGMARVAGERVTAEGVADRVSLCLGDGARPPFAAGVFDGALISFTLELFDTPEIPAVLGACRALLRPGGRLCVVSLSRADANLAVHVYERAHRQFPRWVDCRPIYVRRALAAAGYEILEARTRRMWGLPVEIVLGRIQMTASERQA